MKYSNQGSEAFILIRLEGQECIKSSCHVPATHVLIGRYNNLIEFYCYQHGIQIQEDLENKYQFQKEAKKGRNRPQPRKFFGRRMPPKKFNYKHYKIENLKLEKISEPKLTVEEVDILAERNPELLNQYHLQKRAERLQKEAERLIQKAIRAQAKVDELSRKAGK